MLAVRCWDPDTVSAANIGRQLFSEQEIGQNKAVTLISRYNYHFGLEWLAEPKKFLPSKNYESGNVVVISAVDTRKSRASINAGLKQYYNAYLIDSGCGKDFGQVCIGNGSKELPYPWVIHLELLDEKLDTPVIPAALWQTLWNATDYLSTSLSPPEYWKYSGSSSATEGWTIPNFISISKPAE